ncbi:MAG: DUF6198 family protein [Oscillospiraceae bacterium]|nr:DUF6198 family protein [Oscillospiraceae bacterium]
MERFKESQIPQRLVVYFVGLLVLSLGISISVRAGLGVSPVQSVPLVLSYILPHITIGTCVFIMFTAYMTAQIVLLRREFQWFQLAQIPVAFLFGYLVDLWLLLLGDFRIPTYFGQLLMTVVGIFLAASGIILHVRAKIVALPPDALVVAIMKKFPNSTFGSIKVPFDWSLVLVAVCFSLVFMHGIYGVREGTLIAAFGIGKSIPIARRLWVAPLERAGFIRWAE